MAKEKMSKNPILIILTSLLIILIIVTSGVYLYKSTKQNVNQATQNANTASSNLNSGSGNNNSSVLIEAEHCLKNRKVGTSLITITSPLPYTLVQNPFTVSGTATAFENEFSLRIKDCKGNIIHNERVSTQSTEVGVAGSYSAVVSLKLTEETDVVIEAYDVSMKDGTEENLVQVPVRVAQ